MRPRTCKEKTGANHRSRARSAFRVHSRIDPDVLAAKSNAFWIRLRRPWIHSGMALDRPADAHPGPGPGAIEKCNVLPRVFIMRLGSLAQDRPPKGHYRRCRFNPFRPAHWNAGYHGNDQPAADQKRGLRGRQGTRRVIRQVPELTSVIVASGGPVSALRRPRRRPIRQFLARGDSAICNASRASANRMGSRSRPPPRINPRNAMPESRLPSQ